MHTRSWLEGGDSDVALSRQKEKLFARLRNRRMRARGGLVLVEGLRTVNDVLDADVDVRFAVMSRSLERTGPGDRLRRRLEEGGISLVTVDEDEMARISDTESPQGIALVCKEPRVDPAELLARADGRFLLLDGVQDPGNLGTLVRAGRAFALDGVVALDGTVDPWNPKAVRAAAGTGFRLPVVKAGWSRIRPLLRDGGFRILVGDAAGTDVAEASPERPWVLAVGSEGRGVRKAVADSADATLAVPMPGGAESLNAGVAGSILLYAITCRDRR